MNNGLIIYILIYHNRCASNERERERDLHDGCE